MRDIKFRGIPFDWDQFVCGYYVEYKDHHSIYAEMYEKATHLEILSQVQVDPKTVGQYTGLKDKNGKEIYEGDLLRLPADITWEKENFSAFEIFFHDNNCADNHIGFQMNRMHNYGSVAGGFCGWKFLPKTTAKMEIIGNIHENPELIA